MRSEFWERSRRDIETRNARGVYQERFSPDTPWAAVIRDCARDRSWWDEHVRVPCLIGLRAARNSVKAEPQTHQPKASASKGASAKRKPQAGLKGDVRADGRHIRHKGVEICFAWNRTRDGCASVCKTQPPRAH
eukprot:3976003-Amphidinium_carterae.1